MLAEAVTGRPWHHFLMSPETRFTSAAYAAWLDGMARLERLEPIQYILGKAWFAGLELEVGPGVLIPRPETEELVGWVLEGPLPPAPRILDLCTGSGCIALAMAHHLPQATVTGVDASPEALAYAHRNAARLGLQVRFVEADIFREPPLPFQDLDVVTCNPPYIPLSEQAEMHPNVLGHEPGYALFVPDADPLLYYNKVSALGKEYLRPGGRLYFEVHEARAQEVAAMLRETGWEQVHVRQDMQGKERMVMGVWPGA